MKRKQVTVLKASEEALSRLKRATAEIFDELDADVYFAENGYLIVDADGKSYIFSTFLKTYTKHNYSNSVLLAFSELIITTGMFNHVAKAYGYEVEIAKSVHPEQIWR